jgi:electron transfer flavoprotein alpha/beta subunit
MKRALFFRVFGQMASDDVGGQVGDFVATNTLYHQLTLLKSINGTRLHCRRFLQSTQEFVGLHIAYSSTLRFLARKP